MAQLKIAYLIAEDWFFCSHFLDRAIAAREAGYAVSVITRVGLHGEIIRQNGLSLIPVQFNRRGLNPFKEARTICQIFRAYRELNPNLVHHIALKPILFGSLAAKWTGQKRVINAPVGMGFVFSSQKILARCLRPIVLFFLKKFLNPPNSTVIVENSDDRALFVNEGLAQLDNIVLIKGAGVDLSLFNCRPEPIGTPVVTLVARMLWDKGIKEFVEAARILKSEKLNARFVLVGDPDIGNPGAIPIKTLHDWVDEGIVEWNGARSDIPEVLANSHLVCLPSYREGLPKSLIEALASCRPVVTTDVPGCREVVTHRYNGLLVPVRDTAALAEALKELILSPEARQEMGRKGRERVIHEFSRELVVEQTLAIYRHMLFRDAVKSI